MVEFMLAVGAIRRDLIAREAYLLWEREGHPVGCAEQHWRAAQEAVLLRLARRALIRQRAYEIWIADGRPHGRESEHWQRAEAEVDSGRLEHLGPVTRTLWLEE